MAKIPFTIRRGARYHFRRRLHLPNLIETHVTLPPRGFYEFSEDDEAEMLKALGGARFEELMLDLEEIANPTRISDDYVADALRAIGVAPSGRMIKAGRTHILRARRAAYQRAHHVMSDDILDAPDPVAALADLDIDTDGNRRDGGEDPRPQPRMPVAAKPRPSDRQYEGDTGSASPFLIFDSRPFADLIGQIISDLKSEKQWKGDCSQQRRIALSFAWITGNKALGDYNHLDTDKFKRGLLALPKDFRFGNSERGAMSMPFDKVVAEMAPFTLSSRRDPKTVNRDLSTMSTIGKHLAQTVWRPRIPNSTVLDFASVMISGSKRSEDIDARPAWTQAHMRRMFASPIYTGNGGQLRRLKTDRSPAVWHDAAYFAPLIWYYHHACREEICGLALEDVVLNHAVPHFLIQDNLVRGKDGEKAGEKRAARRRALPLHPEVLRLGFADYVAAIAAEGHEALFPELYVNEQKRGGAQFYERSWQHIAAWIEIELPSPTAPDGKKADIHSIRSLGSSFYEVDGVNEILRADVMGHARTGTNGKYYSKRMQTEGLETVLRERLEFICRYVPILTDGVHPQDIKLLPLSGRSRTGSPIRRMEGIDRSPVSKDLA